MLGSGPDDGDVIEMSAGKPRLAGLIAGRGRLVLVVAGVCALLIAGGAVAAVRLNSPGPAGNPALRTLITEVTTVPVSETVPAPSPTSVEVGAGLGSGAPAPPLPPGLPVSAAALANAPSVPVPVSAPPLTADGKPEVLYVGTEYCPYCAAQSWALLVALSRFGTFTGLRTIRSGNYRPYPELATWTFYGSAYSSTYLRFVPVETKSNVLTARTANPQNGKSYTTLQKLTAAEQAVFNRYDKSGSVPFLDFGNRSVIVGASFSPLVLEQRTWSQIAAALRNPANPAGLAILGTANYITAAICQLTGDQPARACPPAVTKLLGP
jgi:hypothetical protein